MKKTTFFAFAVFLIVFGNQSFAQFATKGDAKNTGGSTVLDQPTTEKTVFETSRKEDIEEFKKFQDLLERMMKSGGAIEVNVTKSEILVLAQNEIARSSMNLADLKAGKTADLEKWQAENKPNTALNLPLEISVLSSRINNEQKLYELIRNKDYSQVKDEREISTYMGYVNSFRNTMLSNLKYDSDNKTFVMPPPPSGDIAQGEGHLSKNESNDEEMADKRLQSWINSQKMRSDKYAKDLEEFEKSANKNDLKAAKYSYRNLVQSMMDEVNSNNWLLGQISSETIELDDFNPIAFSEKIKTQQDILKQANAVKVSTEDDLKANKAKAIDLAEKFGNTLK